MGTISPQPEPAQPEPAPTQVSAQSACPQYIAICSKVTGARQSLHTCNPSNCSCLQSHFTRPNQISSVYLLVGVAPVTRRYAAITLAHALDAEGLKVNVRSFARSFAQDRHVNSSRHDSVSCLTSDSWPTEN